MGLQHEFDYRFAGLHCTVAADDHYNYISFNRRLMQLSSIKYVEDESRWKICYHKRVNTCITRL